MEYRRKLNQEKRINIFPFTTDYFEDVSKFEYYVREVLPDILTVEHTHLRKPDIMVFAYQGDRSLWGYVEIEGWKEPSEKQATIGTEWGGSKFRRLYKIKPCSLKEFKKHIPYAFLLNLGVNTTSIHYSPLISAEIFDQLLRKAEGEINLCKHTMRIKRQYARKRSVELASRAKKIPPPEPSRTRRVPLFKIKEAPPSEPTRKIKPKEEKKGER